MNFSPANLAGLVVAASFAAGLNVYATVLTLGLLDRWGWVALPPGLEILRHTAVLVVCGVLFAAEFVADKIPGLDLVWSALHTFVRIPVAALVAWQATNRLPVGDQMLAAAVGATIAAMTHGSKTALRAVVTPSPEPVSNIALSTAEDVGAVGLTWVAAHHPVLAGGVAVALLAGAVVAARMLWRGMRRAWERTWGRVRGRLRGEPEILDVPVAAEKN